MYFPHTHYEIEMKSRPGMFEAIGKDVASLRASGHTDPLYSVLAAPNSAKYLFHAKLSEDLERSALISGRFYEDVYRELRESPERSAKTKSDYLKFANTYCAALNFELCGKKVFYIQDGLAQQLSATELNIVAPLFQLPFPSCMFVYTSTDVIDLMYKAIEESRPGMRKLVPDYKVPVTVYLSMCNSSSEDLPFRHLNLLVFHSTVEGQIAALNRRLCLDDSWTLEEALRTDWIQLDKEKLGSRAAKIAGPEWAAASDELFYGDALLFFRIILNTCLYLSSADAVTEEKGSPYEEILEKRNATAFRPSRQELKQQAHRASRLPYVLVGGDVPISEPLTHLADNDQKRKLSIRFTVRGHWRNQACGHGMKEHVLRFIKPYNKGPEMAELINRPYLVRATTPNEHTPGHAL
jgi:hypothetical protein